MPESKFPKVLIIGHYFSDDNGTNITLSNLFYNWPADRIAIAAYVDEEELKSSKCMNYYSLGNKEVRVIWPLNLFFKIRISKSFTYSSSQKKEKGIKIKGKSWKYFIYDFLVRKFFISTGLTYIRFQYNVSDELMTWIKEFKPDVIYTLLGDISTMRFIKKLRKETDCRIAVHIMDDWINANPTSFLFTRYWKLRLERDFLSVLQISNIFLAICNKMAEEYERRYNKKFLAFHNPIDLTTWKGQTRKATNNNSFVFTYIGKITKLTYFELFDFSTAIEKANNTGNEIEFHIYTNSDVDKYQDLFKKNQHTKLLVSVPHSEIPKVLTSSDGLLLPLGFDKKSRGYARFSMPTKASEYMISRTPTIVYAPKEIALYEYANKFGWAITVGEKNVDLLVAAILTVVNDKSVTSEIIEKAYDLALNNHTTEVVRENFRKAFIK